MAKLIKLLRRTERQTFFGMGVISGDINQDGKLELVYITDTGGCGGAGSFYKGLLQYRDGQLIELQLPSGYTNKDDSIYGEAGYPVSVYRTEEKYHYRAEMQEADGTVSKTFDLAIRNLKSLRGMAGNTYRRRNIYVQVQE